MPIHSHIADGSDPTDDHGNPLLRGIPDPQNDSDLVRLLGFDPFREPDWREKNRDPLRLLDHLRCVYIPTRKSLEIASALYSCIRNGYARRDPRFPAVWSSFYQLETGLASSEVGPVYANGMTISGITGLGKSHVVLRVLSTLPQTIKHTNLSPHMASLTQIVWLRADMSTGAGIKALLLEILERVDDLLMSGTDYAEQNSGSRVSVERLIKNTIRILKTHFCGVIILDEIQKQNFGQKKGSERVRNFLLKLLNTGIPVVLVGNPLGLTFEEDNGESAQLSRRLQAHAKVRLDPAESYEDSDWKILVQGLWRCQILPQITPLDEDIQRALYMLTGGFPDFLSALLASSQRLAIKRKASALNEIFIQEAARSNSLLKEMKPLIEAFVLKDAFRLQRFSDIDCDYYKEKWILSRSSQIRVGKTHGVEETGQSALFNADPTRVTPYNIVAHGKAAFASECSHQRKIKKKNAASKLSPLGELHLENLKNMIQLEKGRKDDLKPN